jgi:hypothetical protein
MRKNCGRERNERGGGGGREEIWNEWNRINLFFDPAVMYAVVFIYGLVGLR